METAVATVELPAELIAQYDTLAKALGHSRDDLLVEALRTYLADDLDDARRTQQALAEADTGGLIDASVVDEQMAAWLAERGVSRERQAALQAQIETEAARDPGHPACE